MSNNKTTSEVKTLSETKSETKSEVKTPSETKSEVKTPSEAKSETKSEAKSDSVSGIKTETKSEVLAQQPKKTFLETLLYEGITIFGFTINYLLCFILFVLLIVLYYSFVLTNRGKEVISATVSTLSESMAKTPSAVKEVIAKTQ